MVELLEDTLGVDWPTSSPHCSKKLTSPKIFSAYSIHYTFYGPPQSQGSRLPHTPKILCSPAVLRGSRGWVVTAYVNNTRYLLETSAAQLLRGLLIRTVTLKKVSPPRHHLVSLLSVELDGCMYAGQRRIPCCMLSENTVQQGCTLSHKGRAICLRDMLRFITSFAGYTTPRDCKCCRPPAVTISLCCVLNATNIDKKNVGMKTDAPLR